CCCSSPSSEPSWSAGRGRERGRDPDLLVPRAERPAVLHRHGGGAHPPQPDRHLHGDRAAAECRQPELRGARAQPGLHGRAGDRVLRDGGGGGRGGGRARHHAAALPYPRHHQRGRGDDAAMVNVVATDSLRWIILFPALGFLWNLFLGRRLPASAKLVGPGVLLAAFVAAVLAVLQLRGLPEHGALQDVAFQWIHVGPLEVQAPFWLDPLSAVMVLVVTGVGFLIHVYSLGYMEHDPDVPRFFTYLNLFVTAMLILVLADNLLILFVGWEGVGLCSYLLV